MTEPREQSRDRLFRKILVAVDGSSHAERALTAALELAQRCDATLVLFHAVELGPMRAYLDGLVDEAARQVYRRVGEELAGKVLDAAEPRARAGGMARIERVAGAGDAAATIVDGARAGDGGLIEVGSRGLRGLHGLALGSVAQKVTSMAHCPVMVVR